MSMEKNNSEEAKRAAGEQFWLLYYNRVLYETGLITESERNKMTHRISGRRRIPSD